MKELKENNLTKKIISIIILIMLCNFIMPNLSFAVSANEGSSVIGGIAQFLCIIPDAIIGALQNMFVTGKELQAENGDYQIMYSPGIIFSGTVQAFDINFINPNEDVRRDYNSFFRNQIKNYREDVYDSGKTITWDDFSSKLETAKKIDEVQRFNGTDESVEDLNRSNNP